MNDAPTGGLRHKYDVRKAGTGEAVTDCFVLRPDRDPAARVALLAYAHATEDHALAHDLELWVQALQDAAAPDERSRLQRAIAERLVADAARDAEQARREVERADFAVDWARKSLAALGEADTPAEGQKDAPA